MNIDSFLQKLRPLYTNSELSVCCDSQLALIKSYLNGCTGNKFDLDTLKEVVQLSTKLNLPIGQERNLAYLSHYTSASGTFEFVLLPTLEGFVHAFDQVPGVNIHQLLSVRNGMEVSYKDDAMGTPMVKPVREIEQKVSGAMCVLDVSGDKLTTTINQRELMTMAKISGREINAEFALLHVLKRALKTFVSPYGSPLSALQQIANRWDQALFIPFRQTAKQIMQRSNAERLLKSQPF